MATAFHLWTTSSNKTQLEAHLPLTSNGITNIVTLTAHVLHHVGIFFNTGRRDWSEISSIWQSSGSQHQNWATVEKSGLCGLLVGRQALVERPVCECLLQVSWQPV